MYNTLVPITLRESKLKKVIEMYYLINNLFA